MIPYMNVTDKNGKSLGLREFEEHLMEKYPLARYFNSHRTPIANRQVYLVKTNEGVIGNVEVCIKQDSTDVYIKGTREKDISDTITGGGEFLWQ